MRKFEVKISNFVLFTCGREGALLYGLYSFGSLKRSCNCQLTYFHTQMVAMQPMISL